MKIGDLAQRSFMSLSDRNYRLYFTGQLVSQSGTWMQMVAQSFLILRLSHSGVVLGLTTAARFAPMFVLGPWGGAVTDRLNKRRLMLVVQAMSGLIALVFGILTAVGAINIPWIYVLSLVLGLVTVLDNPSRQAILSELVPGRQLLNAVMLNSVSMNAARIVGSAIGGAAVAGLGFAACFYFNAASFLAAICALWLIRPKDMFPSKPEPREPGQVRAGLRYVASNRELVVPMLMVAIIGTFAWEFQISLPILAKDDFHGDAGTYAVMSAMMGIGAVAGGLVSAARTKIEAQSLAVIAIWWSFAIAGAALAPTRVIDYVVLAFVGYGTVTFNASAKTVLQLASAPAMRGRVMALWALAWQGSTPIGGPIIGWIGEEFGGRWSLLAGALPTLAVGLCAYPLLAATKRRQGEPAPPDYVSTP